MRFKKEKFTYWLIGLGSGIVLSGMIMVIIGLKLTNIEIKNQEIKNQEIKNQEIKNQEIKNNETINTEITKKADQQIATSEVLLTNTNTDNKVQANELQSNKSQDNEIKDVQQKELPKPIEETDEKISLYVEGKATATSITQQLKDAGIIEDKEEFLEYIKSKKKEYSLRSGKFIVSKNNTYEEILNILLRK